MLNEGANPALRGVPFAGSLAARVSAFADDITVFVSRRQDIEAVNKTVGEYKRIAGAKVNFDKGEGLQLGAWRGSFAGESDPSASEGCGARPRTGAKLVGSTSKGECSGGNLTFKEVVLKGQGGGARRVRLPLDPLLIDCTSSA